jgi:hypothetical protein
MVPDENCSEYPFMNLHSLIPQMMKLFISTTARIPHLARHAV